MISQAMRELDFRKQAGIPIDARALDALNQATQDIQNGSRMDSTKMAVLEQAVRPFLASQDIPHKIESAMPPNNGK
jgi:hypothetical protein